MTTSPEDQAENAAALLAALEREPAAVFGTSSGANIALAPAATRAISSGRPIRRASEVVYARVHGGALRGYKVGPQYRFRPEGVRAFVEASVAAPDAGRQVRERPRRSAPAGSFRALLEREGGVSVRQVRRGVYQVRWREAGRSSPAHSVMVHGATDSETRRKADMIDAEIRNRKAVGERVLSVVPDMPCSPAVADGSRGRSASLVTAKRGPMETIWTLRPLRRVLPCRLVDAGRQLYACVPTRPSRTAPLLRKRR